MSKVKKILKRYFENSYSNEVQSFFVSWLQRRNDEREIEEGLKEIWENIDIPSDSQTQDELILLKQKLGITQPAVKVNLRYRLYRIAIGFSAACIILAVSMFIISKYSNQTEINRADIFAQLNSTNIDSVKTTTIVAGNVVTFTNDNDSIKQTKEGGITINEKEEINSEEINSELVHVIVPKGRRSQIYFSDGTVAWLNSGTKLIYPKKFGNKARELYVDGELYLEVAKDAERPFVVNTQNMNIRVLGTQFNIRSYVEEAEKTVVLVEGKIEVESVDKRLKEVLTPNQAVFYKGKTIEKRVVDVNNYICWKNGELRLDGESLMIIFNRLSKYYNINIVYEGKGGNKQYKGKLLLGDNIDDVLNAIALKLKFTYKKINDTIYIENGK